MKNINIKTHSNRGYVLGRYDPSDSSYLYLTNGGTWEADIKYARLDAPASNFKIPNTKKYKYNISKVFIKIEYITSNRSFKYANSILRKVTLTNPNYYEKLSAVVNNI